MAPQTENKKRPLAIAALEVTARLVKMPGRTRGQFRQSLPRLMPLAFRVSGPEHFGHGEHLAARTVLQMPLVDARAQEFRRDASADQRLPTCAA